MVRSLPVRWSTFYSCPFYTSQRMKCENHFAFYFALYTLLVFALSHFIQHDDTFRAHARKFKHELVLRTVCMRTKSETTIVLYTVHVRTVNNEKTSLACRARTRKTMVNKQIYTVTSAPCARTNRKSIKRVRRRAHLLIVCNGSKHAVA